MLVVSADVDIYFREGVARPRRRQDKYGLCKGEYRFTTTSSGAVEELTVNMIVRFW